MKWFIRAEDLWFSYDGKVDVIRGVSVEAVPGEVTVIMGPTGCGKSTLLLLLAGLLKPSKGVVYYNGKPLPELVPDVRRYIGLLFQDPDDQLFNATVYDEIAFSLRTLGISEDFIYRKALEVSRFLGIDELLNRQPYNLSVGEKKKVALASILIYDPQVLLLDEPTASLDYRGIQLIEQIISISKSKGKTIIIATHDIDFALKIADKIYLMNNGVIKGWFKPIQLLSRDLLESYGLKPPTVLKLAEKLGIGSDKILEIIRGNQ